MKAIKLLSHESLESTNTWLSENRNKLEIPVAVQTDFQSGGKGQGQKRWESEKGKNILLSIMIPLHELKAEQNFFISKISALAVLDSLNDYVENAVIKWPNDILINGKKIAGILIENSLRADEVIHSIIGMGINLNQKEFPRMELDPTSLSLILGHEIKRDDFLKKLLDYFQDYLKILERCDFDLIDEIYFENLLNYNTEEEYESEGISFKGIIRDVMDDGYMIMETSDGKFRKFGFGEISYRLK